MQSHVDTLEVTLAIAAEAHEFSRATAWLHEACAARGVPPEQQHRLDLCLNEALANVLAHGGREALAAPIRLGLALDGTPGAGRARMTLSAAGVAFNPNNHPQKPPPRSLDDAEPGGLGILLMRANSDEMRYQRRGERNCTTFIIGWDGTGNNENA